MTTPQLLEYIQSQLKLGTDRQTITNTLIGQGWIITDINEGFTAIMSISPQVIIPDQPTTVPMTANPAGASQVQLKKKSKIPLIITLILFILLLCVSGYHVLINRVEKSLPQISLSVPASISQSTTNGTSTTCVTQAPSSNPPTQTSFGSLSVSLLDACSDHAGRFGVFGPGGGTQTADSWHWQLSVTSTAPLTVTSMDMIDNNHYDYWSTTQDSHYPLVIFSNGTQLNNAYGQDISVPAGTNVYDLYGAIQSTPFNGSILQITLSDGKIATTTVASSSSIMPVQ